MVKFYQKGCNLDKEMIDGNVYIKNTVLTEDLYFFAKRAIDYGLFICNRTTGQCYPLEIHSMFVEKGISTPYIAKQGDREEHMRFLRQFLIIESYK